MPWILLSAAAAKVRIFNVWNVRLDPANGGLQAANLPREKGSKRGYSDMLQLQMGSSQDEDVFLLLTKFLQMSIFPVNHDFGKRIPHFEETCAAELSS